MKKILRAVAVSAALVASMGSASAAVGTFVDSNFDALADQTVGVGAKTSDGVWFNNYGGVDFVQNHYLTMDADAVFKWADAAQTFSGLTANTTYTLTFDSMGVGAAFIVGGTGTPVGIGAGTSTDWMNPSNGLALFGTALADTEPGANTYGFSSTSWTPNSFSFTTGSTVADSYTLYLKNTSADVPLSVDNVSLNVQAASNVPEPESYAMLMAGLGALGFMARRRKS